MASFDTLESSRQDSQPIELFRFTIGLDVYRYTSQATALVVAGETWEPEVVGRSEVRRDTNIETGGITLTIPATNAVARRFYGVPPGAPVEVLVTQLQREEPGFATHALIFLGTVTAVKFTNDGNSAELSVLSIEAGLVESTPTQTFMALCNHFVYSDRCGADPTAHRTSGEVTAVSLNGRTLTVTGVAASGRNFVGGYCQVSGSNDSRTVIAQSGDNLTILYQFEESPLGATLLAHSGCDHKIDGDCALVFDRVIAHGGAVHVPGVNPFQTGLPLP